MESGQLLAYTLIGPLVLGIVIGCQRKRPFGHVIFWFRSQHAEDYKVPCKLLHAISYIPCWMFLDSKGYCIGEGPAYRPFSDVRSVPQAEGTGRK